VPPEPAAGGAGEFAETFGASPAQMADLERFRALVAERNEVMNLVGPATLPDFWNRHATDSAQLLKLAPDAKTWADLGAGAGFPGVVLAVMLKGVPGAHVELVDSLTKRCKFLDEVVSELDLPATVHCARAETLSLKVDVVTARACAPMTRLLGFAEPYFKKGALALFLKGESVAAELQDAAKSWNFEPELLPSLSDSRGRVVRIRRLSRARRVASPRP
jgi:16S rRNA (guanine527-N7)-methyltransferase